MSIVTVTKNTYTVEPLHQWDKNQVLEIRGLSLAQVPVIHFASDALNRALVRQATMDAAGVIRVDVPNSMLQNHYTIKAHVCIYEGSTFRTLCTVAVPVKERKQPAEYTLTNDPEVYSFEELEHEISKFRAECDDLERSVSETLTTELGAFDKRVTAAETTAGNAAEQVKNLTGDVGYATQHVWRKVPTVSAGYSLTQTAYTDNGGVKVVSSATDLDSDTPGNGGEVGRDVYYTDTYSVNATTGSIQVGTIKALTVAYDSYDQLATLRGKYWAETRDALAKGTGPVYLCRMDAEYGRDRSDYYSEDYPEDEFYYYETYLSGLYVVTVAYDAGGATGSAELVYADSANVYPASGVSGGYAYTYLGLFKDLPLLVADLLDRVTALETYMASQVATVQTETETEAEA